MVVVCIVSWLRILNWSETWNIKCKCTWHVSDKRIVFFEREPTCKKCMNILSWRDIIIYLINVCLMQNVVSCCLIRVGQTTSKFRINFFFWIIIRNVLKEHLHVKNAWTFYRGVTSLFIWLMYAWCKMLFHVAWLGWVKKHQNFRINFFFWIITCLCEIFLHNFIGKCTHSLNKVFLFSTVFSNLSI